MSTGSLRATLLNLSIGFHIVHSWGCKLEILCRPDHFILALPSSLQWLMKTVSFTEDTAVE